MYSILVVDDSKTNLQLLKQILSERYVVIPVLSGPMALHYLQKHKPNLILLDYRMPEMDGKETMRRIRANKETANIPIVILTADNAGATEAECLSLGANDYITKPFVKEVMMSRIQKTIELEGYRNDLQQQLYEKSMQVEKISIQAITAIANTIDAKDNYTKGHSIRVAEYATAIAKKMGWSSNDVRNLYNVALLHDIGKIGVSDAILNKPTNLTELEYQIIKNHTVIGAEVLKDIKLIPQVVEGALSHHERFDGKGYPNGMKGEEIPLIARILSVADAYDAMTSDRSYRARLTAEQVIAELTQGKGTQFDAEIVSVLLKMLEEGYSLIPIKEGASIQKTFMEESSNLLQRVIREKEAKVYFEASKDYLTGLYNRGVVEIKINQLLAKKETGAFFIIDLDNFKLVNDTFGHIKGDYVLQCFAKILRDNVSCTDIVGRLGGDEFIVFYRGLIQRDMLREKAESLISDFIEVSSKEIALSETSLSIGIAISGVDGDDFESLYKTADKSLYFVKQNGKNSYHFYSNIEDDVKAASSTVTLLDIHHLIDLMNDSSRRSGVVNVEYQEFQKVYHFLQCYMERTRQEIQVILFTLTQKDNQNEDSSILEESTLRLESSILQTLRCIDFSTRYSNRQFIVLLINSNYDGAKLVAKRVKHIYDKHSKKEFDTLYWDIAKISENQQKEILRRCIE